MVAPKKNPPPKPPVTRSKTKNQPTPTPVAATDLEADVTAPMDAEYDTDELAELLQTLTQRQWSRSKGKIRLN